MKLPVLLQAVMFLGSAALIIYCNFYNIVTHTPRADGVSKILRDIRLQNQILALESSLMSIGVHTSYTTQLNGKQKLCISGIYMVLVFYITFIM